MRCIGGELAPPAPVLAKGLKNHREYLLANVALCLANRPDALGKLNSFCPFNVIAPPPVHRQHKYQIVATKLTLKTLSTHPPFAPTCDPRPLTASQAKCIQNRRNQSGTFAEDDPYFELSKR